MDRSGTLESCTMSWTKTIKTKTWLSLLMRPMEPKRFQVTWCKLLFWDMIYHSFLIWQSEQDRPRSCLCAVRHLLYSINLNLSTSKVPTKLLPSTRETWFCLTKVNLFHNQISNSKFQLKATVCQRRKHKTLTTRFQRNGKKLRSHHFLSFNCSLKLTKKTRKTKLDQSLTTLYCSNRLQTTNSWLLNKSAFQWLSQLSFRLKADLHSKR